MTLANRKNTTFSQEVKAGLISLLKQIIILAPIGLIVMLITNGKPPAFVVGLTFCLIAFFVARREQKRIFQNLN
jgi:hypothetical protein